MLSMVNTEFSSWLNDEISSRGWSGRELGRRAGLSSAAISQVMTNLTNPGLDFCVGVARAFNLPAEVVLRRANLIPPRPEVTPSLRQAEHLFAQLDEDKQELFLLQMRAIVEAKRGGPTLGEPSQN